jgi:hypothetical protein
MFFFATAETASVLATNSLDNTPKGCCLNQPGNELPGKSLLFWLSIDYFVQIYFVISYVFLTDYPIDTYMHFFNFAPQLKSRYSRNLSVQ